MMHIVIFGATGATGRCLVEQALDQGYDVTAFARNPLALTLRHDRLSIVRGDVFQPATVREAIANQDVVLCAIGGHDRLRVALSGHPRSPGLCTIGTRNIIEAMRSLGVSLYWLLGSSVQKLALQDGERSSSPTCKHMRVGVESGVVDSILMLEQRHSHVMEKMFYGRCFHHSPAAEG